MYMLIDTFTYCNMITTLALVNTSNSSHNCHFFFVMRIITIYSLSNFEVSSTVLLTIITMPCVASPGLPYLLVLSLYLCTTHPKFPYLPWPGNHHSTLCLYNFGFLRYHTVYIFISLTIALKVHPCSCKCKDFLLLWLNDIQLWMYTKTFLFIHPLVDTWTVSLS